MNINPYSIGPSLSGIFILILGVYVLFKNIRSPLNRSFFISYLSVAIWLTSYSILYNLDITNPLILNYYKIAYCGINFIAITFFTHIALWTDNKWTKVWNICNYIYGVFVCILIIKTDFIVSGVYSYYFGPYPKAGKLHPLFISYFIFLILIQIKFLFDALKDPSDQRSAHQIKYILIGYFMMSLASFDFLPNYGIEFYPSGFLFSSIFALLVCYAIVKHELMDIKIVIRKSLIYSIFITCLTLIYLLAILLFEHYFQGLFGYRTLIGSMTASIIIAVLFIPLKNKIQYLIDRIFFNMSHIQIIHENELLRQEVTQTEKFKTIATFASGMAHEIKNPLTVIKTFAEYLPKKLNDKEFVTKFVPIVNKEVERINELVHDLLEYAKPSPLVLKATNINKLINDTLDILNNQLIIKKINTIRELNETKSNELLIDSKQIKQSFLNIFINAIDALPSGGCLRVTTESQDSKFIIKITDTGCGIAKEDLFHIFDPFFTKKENGTGLGLSITYGIITEHGGRIFAESEVGRGTTFRIELPIRKT
jgi:signal transduction histidine kinase